MHQQENLSIFVTYILIIRILSDDVILGYIKIWVFYIISGTVKAFTHTM